MNYLLLIITSVIFSNAQASDLIKNDLKELCKISQESLVKIKVDVVMGLGEFSDKTKELKTEEIKGIISAIIRAPDSKKAQLLQQGLLEVGQPKWSCPAFNEIYGI